ncbi:hypothetical protein V8F06_003441 [Rhypophila decipiens]
MASRNSLSDDWEDVADDNLSVISFSSADPDADAASVKSNSDQDATHTEPRTTQDEGLIQPPNPTTEPQPHISDPPKETVDDGCKDDPAPATSDAEQCNSVDNQLDELSQLFQGPSIDSEVDPLSLHRTLESLRDILQHTTQELEETVTGLPGTARSKSLAACNLLSSQVAVLLPIALGYAKAWSGMPQDLDLDPNLHTWLTAVRAKVLNLQAEVRAISRSSLGSSLNLVAIWNALLDYQRKMEDFLPIIQVDFNEFQTRHMNIPIATSLPTDRVTEPGTRGGTIDRSEPIDIPQPSGSSSSPTYSAEFAGGPSNQLWLLRHELYRLKDLLQQTMESLSYKRGLSDSGAALAADILSTYKRLHTTLGTALSNHGSDWIDSGLAGGLTYPEFLGLDAECIRDFAGELRDMMQDIPGDTKEPWTSGWAAQLESLEIFAMVLGVTLTPDSQRGK